MRKVLVVTPNFPPVAYPDMQRVRMALPYCREAGWEPLILRVDPAEQVGPKDELLCATLPADLRVWQAGCIPRALTGWLGVRSVGLRSALHLARQGDRIIEEERPALAFFSTTMFPLFALGPRWRRRYRLPYVLDFQDPWVAEDPAVRPGLKARIDDLLARCLEPPAVLRAAHVVCVSPAYPAMLQARYRGLDARRFTVLPFGASEDDWRVLEHHSVRQPLFPRGDGLRHWVYAGRAGPDMRTALRALFRALQIACADKPESVAGLRLHFVGTDYAAGDEARKWVEPLAEEFGVQEFVRESPQRIGYFEALACLRDADALLVPGSDDPGYSPSKIFPYILARKPLLAILHESSAAAALLRELDAGVVATFESAGRFERAAQEIARAWFGGGDRTPPRTQWNAFGRHSARQMARQLCECFDAVALEAESQSQ